MLKNIPARSNHLEILFWDAVIEFLCTLRTYRQKFDRWTRQFFLVAGQAGFINDPKMVPAVRVLVWFALGAYLGIFLGFLGM
jgi:hypothetical protein